MCAILSPVSIRLSAKNCAATRRYSKDGTIFAGAGAATVTTCITVTYGIRLLRVFVGTVMLCTCSTSIYNHAPFGLESLSFPFKLTSTPQCTGHLLHHRCSGWMIRGFGGLTGWWQHYVTPTGDFCRDS